MNHIMFLLVESLKYFENYPSVIQTQGSTGSSVSLGRCLDRTLACESAVLVGFCISVHLIIQLIFT